MTSSYQEQPGDLIQYKGPANWFSLLVPSDVQVRRTDTFLELTPDNSSGSDAPPAAPAWSMTLYAAWVDEQNPESRTESFGVAALFPSVIHSAEQPAVSLPCRSRCWAGRSRLNVEDLRWWQVWRLLQFRPTFDWRLWILEYQEIMVVVSLQSARNRHLSDDVVEVCTAAIESMQFAETLARPPEAFRNDVLSLARDKFPLLEVKSSGSFSVQIQDSEISLANFYRNYLQAPDQFERIVLPGLTTVVRLQERSDDQLMPPLSEIRDRIMPMLYPASEADTTLAEFVNRPWVGGLSVMFVVDEDDTYRFVHSKMLQHWDLSVEELEQIALENLDTYARQHPLQVNLVGDEDDPRIMVPVNPDAYNSARILGQRFHERLRELFGPELVVGVPNRDFFVAVSLQHQELIGQVREQVLKDYQSMHHPLTRRLLVISLDGVSEYTEV
jgi:hypothetical protein